ncbi:UDP-N-acetylglucosamine--N-acetylmuramyl-(pentapeptide) pyrophosphoryl-undecaprenol N-acetylglucosamine transferase [Candidatus Gottesmanbacteria bacterium]|nr:UDP-N-acetylglucosamine--N-acetylmuramyl-(pentapeptide) pyrophosphoryl-undecaprenol N-acetylglucosamine transferase [Candidatus Gottesmanbacteria bacterium]
MNKRVFITGGHLTPAIAVIHRLVKENIDIFYIGRDKSAFEDSSYKIERETIEKYGSRVKYLRISAGKLQRYFSISSIFAFIKIPIGFIQSILFIKKYKPNLVLSFGGYIGLPVAIAGYLSGIPIVIHEQTQATGFANKVTEGLAFKILLSWPSEKIKNNQKAVLTGLPLRKDIYKENKKLPVIVNKPILYISGGSQGSHLINQMVKKVIAELLTNFTIIHQCGSNEKFNDLDQMHKLKETLPQNLKDRYFPLSYIDEDYLGWLYKNTYIAIGRSGANTVYEFAAIAIPSIFIPLPFASGNEQMKNAEFFQDNNAGIIINQRELSTKSLLNAITKMDKNYKFYLKNAKSLKLKIALNADQKIADVVGQILQDHSHNEKEK